jgi:rod shape-determining protein MreD
MNDTYELRGGESHIEVHKFYPGALIGVAAIALILQRILPVYIPKLEILDLPLLVTIYFGLSRRNPSTGLLLGMMMGLLQDSLSGPTVPFGEYGIAKTIVGYVASSIGSRLDTEHPLARFALTAGFFVLHQAVLALVLKFLLAEPAPWFTVHMGIAALVNAVLGVALFAGMDRLRRQ